VKVSGGWEGDTGARRQSIMRNVSTRVQSSQGKSVAREMRTDQEVEWAGAGMVPDQGMGPRDVMAWVEEEVRESLRVKQALLQECVGTLAAICAALAERQERGGKLLLFGNGGSAADAQHIAAEFVGRYQLERVALPAIALTVNSSTVTAVANDYGYEEVFARQIGAFGAEKDAAIGISTSGNSPNVLRGISAARQRGMLTVGFTGHTGGELKKLAGLCLCVPSDVAARIQECHILAGHILSGHCERAVAKQAAKAAGNG
jgi:D-sedoheptulose 7-phosphate isomerase